MKNLLVTPPTLSRIKGIATVLTVMLLLMPAAAEAQTSYGISVGGVSVTSDNATNITGTNITSGTAAYDHATKTLTLDNVTIVNSGIGVTTQGQTLNIHLKGTNSITNLYRGVTGNYQNAINFTGDTGATLTITLTSQQANYYDHGLWNTAQAIWASGGTVSMDGVNITAKGCRYGISADQVSIKNSQFTVDGLLTGIEISGGGTLSIDNSTVDITVKMNDGAETSYYKDDSAPRTISTRNISLRDCKITTSGISDTQGDNIGVYQSTILDDADNVVTELKIEPAAGITPPTRYDLYLGRTRVNSNNAAGLTSANSTAITAGSASYDAATNTLMLNNATINGSGTIDGLRSSIVGMTIKLVGNNTINNTTGEPNRYGEQFAMELAKWNTITSDDGNGTLTTEVPATTGSYGSICAISDYDQSGAMYIKHCTMTIKGGEMGINTKGQPLKIQDATVTLQNTDYTSYTPIYANPFNLIDCEIVTPTSAYITEWGNLAVSDESQSLKTVVIKPIGSDKKKAATEGNGTCYTETQTASITSDGSSTEANVQIPETLTADGGTYTVTTIGDGAYQGNTSVQTVTIPATVDYVGEGAFNGCTNLTDITFESTAPPYTDRDSFGGTTSLTTAAYPAAADNAYQDAYNNGWLPGTTYDIYQPTVMMQDNEWVTIYSTKSYSLSGLELEAYIVTGIDYVNKQVLIRQEQGIIQGVPMLLRKLGSAKNYAMPKGMSVVQDGIPCTEFKGAQQPQEITAAMVGKAYILHDNKFVQSQAGTLPAYKCYLLTDGTFAAAPAITIVIDHGNGQTTPVSQLRAGQPAAAAAPYYTLDGRRLTARPTRPGLYISNGRKVIIK